MLECNNYDILVISYILVFFPLQHTFYELMCCIPKMTLIQFHHLNDVVCKKKKKFRLNNAIIKRNGFMSFNYENN